jgi:hypothetical protein
MSGLSRQQPLHLSGNVLFLEQRPTVSDSDRKNNISTFEVNKSMLFARTP